MWPFSPPKVSTHEIDHNLASNVETAEGSMLIPKKRDVHVASTEEIIIKQEQKLKNAQITIKKLHEQIGTTIVSSSSGSDSGSDDGIVSIDIEQRDNSFAKAYTFKTNVSRKYISIQIFKI